MSDSRLITIQHEVREIIRDAKAIDPDRFALRIARAIDDRIAHGEALDTAVRAAADSVQTSLFSSRGMRGNLTRQRFVDTTTERLGPLLPRDAGYHDLTALLAEFARFAESQPARDSKADRSERFARAQTQGGSHSTVTWNARHTKGPGRPISYFDSRATRSDI